MNFSTVTSKGQITVPNKIRKLLGLKPGDKIEFRLSHNGSQVMFIPSSKKSSDVFGILAHHAGKKPLSLAQMDHAIREKIKRVRP